MDLATFAADRIKQLDSIDASYRPAVHDALAGNNVVADLNEALRSMFSVLVEEQTGAPASIRQTETFLADMAPAVERTEPDGTEAQEDRIVSWFSTATLGASTMTASPGAGTKTWITMSDEAVRDIHQVMHGNTIDSHEHFSVGEPPVRMAYPGQPVGDPENWINCRCVMSIDNAFNIAASLTAASEKPWDGSASRFTDEQWCKSCIISLEDGCTSKSQHKLPIREPNGTLSRAGVHAAAGRLNQTDAPPDKIASAKAKLRGAYDELGEDPPDSLTAAADDVRENVVLVALPADEDPVHAASSEDAAHCTMLFFGPAEGADLDAIRLALETVASEFEPVDAPVTSRETLGDDDADVVMLDPGPLATMRDKLLIDPAVAAAHDAVEQFPQWTPHTTLGYPNAPARGDVGEAIRFDRLALWTGDSQGPTFDLTGTPAPDPDLLVESEPEVDDTLLESDDDEPPPTDPLIIDGEDIPVHGVLVGEGAPSGDGRMFQPDSLTHRDLPLPLKWQKVDLAEHDGSIIVGRMDNLERDDDMLWWFDGGFVDVLEADEVIGLIAERALRGLSIDADQGTQVEPSEGLRQEFAAARTCSATIVAIPAFHESFIALGARSDSESPREDSGDESPTTSTFARGPGWVTDPVATKRIHDYWTKPGHAGYAKIRWGTPGDFTRLRRHLRKYVNPQYLNRTAAQWHHDALGYWPGQKGLPGNPPKTHLSLEGSADMNPDHSHSMTPPSHTHSVAPALNLVAAAPAAVVPAAHYRNPMLTAATPLTVDGRHVFGHIAKFGECHIGLGKCTEAPRSMTDYAYFHLGTVMTDEGEIAVGRLTLNTSHANMQASATDAMRHYDHTGTIVATVRAGEDDYGIWVAGSLCDGVPDDQVRVLKASAGISGDWRNIGGNLELVAALAVNVPGFPIPRTALAASGGVDVALVAANIVVGSDLDAIADAVLERFTFKMEKAARLNRVKAAQRIERVAVLASAEGGQ